MLLSVSNQLESKSGGSRSVLEESHHDSTVFDAGKISCAQRKSKRGSSRTSPAQDLLRLRLAGGRAFLHHPLVVLGDSEEITQNVNEASVRKTHCCDEQAC